MKKWCSILLVSLLVSGSVLAEEAKKPARKMAILANPISMVFLRPSASFQLAVSNKIALVFPFHVQLFTGSSSVDGTSSSNSAFGIGGGVGAKFFITGDVFEDSLYIQPVAEIGWLGIGGANFLTLSGSAILGYGWVWNSGFSLNIGLGMQYIYVNHTVKSSNSTVTFNGLLPDAEFSLGYSW